LVLAAFSQESFMNLLVVLRKRFNALALFTLLFFAASFVARAQDAQQPAPDNSKTNQADRDQSSATADQQKMNPADRDLTRKIRSAIMSDKSLSTYAHNVKIISREGKVTLKGPVRSDDEKAAVLNKATNIAGQENVIDQLQIAPKKS
jgi:hyperosmotically inducible periplasmic protein